jgi:hypothetical protein
MLNHVESRSEASHVRLNKQGVTEDICLRSQNLSGEELREPKQNPNQQNHKRFRMFRRVSVIFRPFLQDVLHSMISARKSFESFLTEIPTLWWTIITICWLSICFSAGTVILNCEIVKFARVEGCKRQEARETH